MTLKTWLLVGAGCALCCALPLMALLGLGGVAGVGAAAAGLGGPEIACLVVVAGALAVGVAWAWRSRVKRYASGEICEIGGPCDPKATPERNGSS